ncbi:MAG: hypothetical protein ACYDEY_08095 [Acidimicrobiales bacterium]
MLRNGHTSIRAATSPVTVFKPGYRRVHNSCDVTAGLGTRRWNGYRLSPVQSQSEASATFSRCSPKPSLEQRALHSHATETVRNDLNNTIKGFPTNAKTSVLAGAVLRRKHYRIQPSSKGSPSRVPWSGTRLPLQKIAAVSDAGPEPYAICWSSQAATKRAKTGPIEPVTVGTQSVTATS